MNPLSNDRSQRSDPYRIARKTHSPADSYDSSKLRSETEAHSRSASDSSTSRLASQPSYDRRGDDYYTDDPYAPRLANYRQHMRQGTPESHDTETTANSSTVPLTTQHQQQQQQQQHIENDQEQKANSYLPYSHHPPGKNGELYQPPATSMLLESEHIPSFTSPHGRDGGIGSLLQDNIIMDMVETPIRTHHKETTVLDPLPPLNKKKRRRCFGLGRRRMAAIGVPVVIAITLVWFFVWPRTFDITFVDADLYSDTSVCTFQNEQPIGFQALWKVSMKTNNNANWIPTHVNALDLTIYDKNTTRQMGTCTNTTFVFAPKTKTEQFIHFFIDVNYRTSTTTDPTIQHICSSCYVNPEPSPQQQQPPAENLYLTMKLTYHIAGLAWSSETYQNVEIPCPS